MEKLLVNSSFKLFGLQVPFYGFFMAIAFLSAILICLYFCKIKGYDADLIFNLVLVVLPSSIVGARLYYVIFSQRAWSFVEILQIWNGGLAVYGGIIGGVLGIIIYCLIKKESIVKVFDLVAPALLLGQAIGRIGCYFAGCCYGELVSNTSLQWFPFSVLRDDGWHYATFFYESFWCLIGFVVLLILFKKINIKGFFSGCYFVWYGIGRLIIEGFRGDSLYLGNIRVSQLLSGLVVLLGIVWLIIFIIKYKKENIKEPNIEKTEKDL